MLSRRVLLVSFVAVACAPARSPDASVVAVERVAVDVPRSEPPDPRARLAGPGTTLDIDELRAVAADARIRDQDVPYGERVELAQQRLGVSGEPMRDPVGEGTRFVGSGSAARTIAGRGAATSSSSCGRPGRGRAGSCARRIILVAGSRI